jgi:hypothetical protein
MGSPSHPGLVSEGKGFFYTFLALLIKKAHAVKQTLKGR